MKRRIPGYMGPGSRGNRVSGRRAVGPLNWENSRELSAVCDQPSGDHWPQ